MKAFVEQRLYDRGEERSHDTTAPRPPQQLDRVQLTVVEGVAAAVRSAVREANDLLGVARGDECLVTRREFAELPLPQLASHLDGETIEVGLGNDAGVGLAPAFDMDARDVGLAAAARGP